MTGLFDSILDALLSRRTDDDWNPPGSSNPPTYHWRCECGAHSRGPDIKADAEVNAQAHQLRKPVGHPMPEVYSE